MEQVLTPQQLDREGKAAYQKKDWIAAQRAFQAAEGAFIAAGDLLMAAEMTNNRSVVLLKAGDAQTALDVLNGIADRYAASGDLRRQGMTLGNQGAALEALGRLDEALAVYEESAELLKKAGEFDLRSHVQQSISMIQFRTGKQLQALASMQAGMDAIPKPSPRQRFLKKLLHIPMKIMPGG